MLTLYAVSGLVTSFLVVACTLRCWAMRDVALPFVLVGTGVAEAVGNWFAMEVSFRSGTETFIEATVFTYCF